MTLNDSQPTNQPNITDQAHHGKAGKGDLLSTPGFPLSCGPGISTPVMVRWLKMASWCLLRGILDILRLLAVHDMGTQQQVKLSKLDNQVMSLVSWNISEQDIKPKLRSQIDLMRKKVPNRWSNRLNFFKIMYTALNSPSLIFAKSWICPLSNFLSINLYI